MTESHEFVVRYPITADAAVDAMRLAHARLLRVHLIGDVFAIFAGLLGFVSGYEWAIVLTLLGILFLIETRTSLLQRWRVARRGRSMIGQVSELTIGEDGIAYRMPQGSGRMDWSALTRVLSDQRSIVFMRDGMMLGWLPVSALASPAEGDDLVAFSRARIAAARAGGAANPGP